MVIGLSKWMLVGALATSTMAGLPMATRAEFQQSETIVLSATNRPTVDVRGYARGTVALFKTLGGRDAAQRRCMGYGSLMPDHIIQVQEKLPKMLLRVNARTQDTTLVVEGPNNTLYCADDSPEGDKDAGLVLTNVQTGQYKIWIGAFEPGTGFRYNLKVQALLNR